MWYMIYDDVLYNKWYMIYVWNDMQCHIWYDKKRYMIYNIEVCYTDMAYLMTWYILYIIRYEIYDIYYI